MRTTMSREEALELMKMLFGATRKVVIPTGVIVMRWCIECQSWVYCEQQNKTNDGSALWAHKWDENGQTSVRCDCPECGKATRENKS